MNILISNVTLLSFIPLKKKKKNRARAFFKKKLHALSMSLESKTSLLLSIDRGR